MLPSYQFSLKTRDCKAYLYRYKISTDIVTSDQNEEYLEQVC